MTVTGTTAPVSSKIWVIPGLRPRIPAIARTRLIHLDLDVHAGRKVQLRQGAYGLRPRLVVLDVALGGLQPVPLAALLGDVRRAHHRPALHARGQRDRSAHPRPRLLRRTHDVRGGLVDHRVIERLESDPDLPSHARSPILLPRREPGVGNGPGPCARARARPSYCRISVTTPAPTVRPPSRIAKRSSLSIAIGVISSISICTLSPGITISTPSGSDTEPVTSVVRK